MIHKLQFYPYYLQVVDILSLFTVVFKVTRENYMCSRM